MITELSNTLKVYYRYGDNKSDFSLYTFDYLQDLGLKNTIGKYEVGVYKTKIMPKWRYFA